MESLCRLDRLCRSDRDRYRVIAAKYKNSSIPKSDATREARQFASADRDAEEENALADQVMFREIESLAVRCFAELPLPPVLVLEVPGLTGSGTVTFDFRKSHATRKSTGGRPYFTLPEIEAILEAAEANRLRPVDFLAYCKRKIISPKWRLTRDTALEGANGLIRRIPKPKGWTLGRLLTACDTRLRLIRIGDAEPKASKRSPKKEDT